MKKRILSVALATAMVISSFATAFAAIDITGDSNAVYEGNKPFILAEKILDNLNVDAATDLDFTLDKTLHEQQLAVIKGVNDSLSGIDYTDIGDAIDLVTANLSDYQKLYLAALVMAYDNSDTALQDELKKHPTAGLPLKDSFGLLDDYIAEMSVSLKGKGLDYEPVKAETRKYVAEPLIAILKVMFAQDGTADSYAKDGKYMRENYIEEFINNDRAKKTLAVLFGAELTKEIVSDGASASPTRGIVYNVKKYISGNESKAISDIKSYMNSIMSEDKKTAVDNTFDALGAIVNDAYSSSDLQDKVTTLMGNGTEPGLVELMVKAVDNGTLDASNIWLNLFLSEFIQVGDYSGNFKTIDEKAAPAEIEDNDYLYFRTEGLDDYGIGNGQASLSMNTGWFDVAFYDADTEAKIANVTYDSRYGKISVTEDENAGEKYDAYMVLYRKALVEGKEITTFIESYPVTIVNKTVYTGGGGLSTQRFAVKYETNGGNKLTADYFAKGSTVQLTKVPVKEGYKFAGWYLDAALTQKADSVVMDSALTVYAAWVEAEGEVDSGVGVPGMLNGDEHFAYVVGYPGGEIRPEANITRAETVTIIFRLLKDAVRGENLKTENQFVDVNEADWFNTAISTLAGLGIVNGRTETEFKPNDYITRAEFATVFARFADFESVKNINFSDIAGHWAENDILESASYGWITGYDDGSFKPDKLITRAEAMTLVNRVLKRVPESAEDLLQGMNKWTDNNETAWYYLAVQEATNSHTFARKSFTYEKWLKLTENKDWSVYEN